MRTRIFWVVALLLVAAGASADTAPYRRSGSNTFVMCDAETGDGVVCTNAESGDQIVLDTKGIPVLSVDFSESTATAFDCDVIGSNIGYDELTAAGGTGQVLNSVAYSPTQKSSLIKNPMRYVWVYCTTTTGAVTSTVFAR